MSTSKSAGRNGCLHYLLGALALLSFGSAGFAAGPKLPYSDPGACPFECCQYAEWTATTRQKAYTKPSAAASQAFTVRAGEKVQALTGVVITRKTGLVVVRRQTTFRDVTVPAGARLYVLHLMGEGDALFWYKGAAHTGELYASSVHKGNSHHPWDVLSVPQTQWWVKVMTRKGAFGWILNQGNFRGMDACGSP